MNQDEYNSEFEVNDKESKLLKAAFDQVSDIRKFEIELYWKRATYFWALIAIAFAGYFSILASEHIPSKFFLSLVVSCIGFVFTFAWFLSSRGSKYWQENWENHLDLLENNVTGPLSVSVSKINQWVSIFIVFSWCLLVGFSAYNSLKPLGLSKDQWLNIGLHAFVIAIALAVCLMMFGFGKTHKDKHSPKVVERKTEIG